jgi:uncharacterized protein YdaU (DUF1376 family)
MHYYQHHIGDFIKDTSFLTNEEVGIYLKLLWLYYDTEQPLPNAMFELSMKVNARDQQDALVGILGMFFKLEDNEWHHTRCDKEIKHYHQQLDTASKAGKASAAKRALNKNSTGVEQALKLRSTDVQPTNNQEPLTINQEPKVKTQRGSRLPVDFVLPEDWIGFCQQYRKDLNPQEVFDGFKDFWISKPGAGGVKLDWTATWRNWVRSQSAPKTFANKYDVAHVTTPTPPNQDAALRKIEEDRKRAVPPSLETLAKLAELRKGVQA